MLEFISPQGPVPWICLGKDGDFSLAGSRDLLFADVVKRFEDTGLIAFN
jgi:hypothetical protein